MLPPIGAEIPCSRLAVNTPLRIKDALVSVDFRGGIKYRVDVNPDDPINSVRLRIVGHRVIAELPGEDSETRCTVTMEQNDIDIDAKSTLRMTQQFPPRLELREVTTFTMTFDRLEGETEPLVLTAKEPMVLIGQLTRFPPGGDLYQLQNPVDLVNPEDPDKAVATIEKFPVKSGGL